MLNGTSGYRVAISCKAYQKQSFQSVISTVNSGTSSVYLLSEVSAVKRVKQQTGKWNPVATSQSIHVCHSQVCTLQWLLLSGRLLWSSESNNKLFKIKQRWENESSTWSKSPTYNPHKGQEQQNKISLECPSTGNQTNYNNIISKIMSKLVREQISESSLPCILDLKITNKNSQTFFFNDMLLTKHNTKVGTMQVWRGKYVVQKRD